MTSVYVAPPHESDEKWFHQWAVAAVDGDGTCPGDLICAPDPIDVLTRKVSDAIHRFAPREQRVRDYTLRVWWDEAQRRYRYAFSTRYGTDWM